MIAALLALLACGPSYDCAAPTDTLVQAGADALSCHEAQWAVDYVALLAGRPVPRGDRRLALGAVATRFAAEPASTRAWLEQVREAGWTLAAQQGLDGAEARAKRVWAAQGDRDLIRSDHRDLWNVQKRALSVWGVADDDELALTESDIEGWIRYASLCREAQQGGVLRISVADRVTVYRMLQDRFHSGTRADRVALAAVGPYWDQVHDNWQVASFDRQQGWIGAAPLPPPMTATSLGYVGAIIDGDVGAHARVMHQKLGPFILGGREPTFRKESQPE